mmetsp:Transcript_37762/g.100269  ORF Transcript_37762/g.100269 Transcript_37762/m.100269 type:complete len:230 (-) Transcript_37762:80-769(-)
MGCRLAQTRLHRQPSHPQGRPPVLLSDGTLAAIVPTCRGRGGGRVCPSLVAFFATSPVPVGVVATRATARRSASDSGRPVAGPRAQEVVAREVVGAGAGGRLRHKAALQEIGHVGGYRRRKTGWPAELRDFEDVEGVHAIFATRAEHGGPGAHLQHEAAERPDVRLPSMPCMAQHFGRCVNRPSRAPLEQQRPDRRPAGLAVSAGCSRSPLVPAFCFCSRGVVNLGLDW